MCVSSVREVAGASLFPLPSSINGTFAMSGAGTAAYLLLSACIVPEYRMSLQLLRSRVRVVFLLRSLAAGILLIPAGGLAAPADDPIAVNVDQAKLVKFPDRIATIVVGNPLIADVTLQPGGIVVVTGKGYGATNVIAMDRTGAILMDRVIQVEGPTDKVVTIYRGVERESYSCAPVCQRRVTLGDGETYFKSTMDQAGALSGQASGVGAKVN
jgi:Flp pilus assembly secretin CpaC